MEPYKIRRRPKLHQLGEIIETVIDGIEVSDENGTDVLKQLRGDWRKIVGEAMSRVTFPMKINNGELTIKVKNAIWRQELYFQKKNIITKINETLESGAVRNINFR